MLAFHIFICMVSLGLHTSFLAVTIHGTQSPFLAKSTYTTLALAVASGLLLINGTVSSTIHSLSMLGIFGALHAALFRARHKAALVHVHTD